MAEAIIAPVGMISRAQRYKKATKKEEEELKICVFLIRNIRLIAADIQSIALLIASAGASADDMIHPHARSTSVRRLKNVRTALLAQL